MGIASPKSRARLSELHAMTADRAPLGAAVLAGGQSRRMGTDKALLPLVAGGQPMLGVVLERLSAVADETIVVANEQARYAAFGVRVVPDLSRHVGALGGIQAAIAWSAHEHCMVVACDMPFLSLPLLRRMAEEPRDYDVLVPLIPGESRQRGDGLVFQTLHAIYSKRCLPFIEKRIAEGRKQVVGFFDDVRVRTLDVAEILRWDPDLRSFFNANTPEAMLVAAQISALAERDASV
jgi:molybdopterin-guanine dinucleotide biosynthesis protein A